MKKLSNQHYLNQIRKKDIKEKNEQRSIITNEGLPKGI